MSALFHPSIIIDTKILDCKVGQEVGENVGIAVGMLPINVYEDAVDISVTCEYRGKLKVEYVEASSLLLEVTGTVHLQVTFREVKESMVHEADNVLKFPLNPTSASSEQVGTKLRELPLY